MNKQTENRPDKNNPGREPGTGNKNPSSSIKTFASFALPAYRTYYVAMIGNWCAMSMQMLVRSLLIYRLTGSAAMVGTISLAMGLPTILVSLFGGAIGDRTQKKYILLWGRVGSALMTLIIAVTLTTGYLSANNPGSWWLLIVTAIFDGAIMGFIAPANTTIIQEIVGTGRVMNGISLSQMGQNIFRLAGPAIAGYLIDAYGFAPVYFLMTGLYVFSVIGTTFLPRTSTIVVRGGNALRDVLGGLQYLKRDTLIMVVVVFGLCHVISAQPFTQLLPVFTEDILQVSASKLGLLNVISAIGALVISLILASIPSKKRGILLLLSGVVMSIPIAIFCFNTNWSMAVVTMLFVGIGPSIHGAITSTLVQSYAEPAYRSRMQSLVTMGMALASFGAFLTGVLSDAFGVQWAVGSMAIFLTAVSLGLIVFSPRLRKLD